MASAPTWVTGMTMVSPDFTVILSFILQRWEILVKEILKPAACTCEDFLNYVWGFDCNVLETCHIDQGKLLEVVHILQELALKTLIWHSLSSEKPLRKLDQYEKLTYWQQNKNKKLFAKVFSHNDGSGEGTIKACLDVHARVWCKKNHFWEALIFFLGRNVITDVSKTNSQRIYQHYIICLGFRCEKTHLTFIIVLCVVELKVYELKPACCLVSFIATKTTCSALLLNPI